MHSKQPSTVGLPATEFAFLWAAAILLQYISQLSLTIAITTQPFTPNGIVQALLLISAAILLIFPSRILPLLATAVLQLAHVAIMLPDIPNHRLFTGLINGTIVTSAAILLIRKKACSLDSLWQLAAPIVRILVATTYLFAALAKTNYSYLDPGASCVKSFLDEMNFFSHVPFAQETLTRAGIYSSLALEWSLPFLLLLPVTRSLAMIVALGFHFVLAFDTTRHFMDFSAVMIATVAAFSPHALLKKNILGIPCTIWLGRSLIIGVILCIYFGHFYPNVRMYFSFTFVRDITWMLYAAPVLIFSVTSFRRRTKVVPAIMQQPEMTQTRSVALLALPLLAILNGLTPYLGLKTKSSWDMYSNLRVEGSAPNHIIFGGGLDLLGELRYPIHIVASTNKTLQKEFAEAGYDIVPLELREIFVHDPEGTTTFIWHGQTYTNYSHKNGETNLSRPIPWLERKLVWFRPVDQQTPERCQR